jgi:Ca2+-binding RTX toxin-like protein
LNDTFNGVGANEDIMFGDAGNDTLNGNNGNDRLFGDSGNDRLNGGDGVDFLYGGEGNDDLSGGIGNDSLFGGTGNDELNGGIGADTMNGWLGNDTYVVDSAGDVIVEAPNSLVVAGPSGPVFLSGGTDLVRSSISFSLVPNPNIENLTLLGGGNLNGTGNNLNNTITGNSGNNNLSGGDGNDTLIGENGIDTLIGGAGNDTLIGGAGNDILAGGSGSDRFQFNNVSDRRDTIIDFSLANDRILISRAGFGGGLGLGALPAFRFVNNTTGLAANPLTRFIYNRNSGVLSFDRDGTGGVFAPVAIANLTANLAFTSNNIQVIA